MKTLPNRAFIIICGIFILAGVFGCAQKKEPVGPITVKAGADKDVVAIGDKIKYSIIITKDKDVEVEPLAFGQDLGNFAIKDFGSQRSVSFNKEKISQWYLLDTYVTGKSSIPKVTIKYKRKQDKDWRQIEAPEVTIEVKSVLEKAVSNAQMRDIRGPVSLSGLLNKYLVFAVLAVFAALGVLARYFLLKSKKAGFIPKKPAHEIAYSQLEALKKKDYITQGRIKEYYTEVSDIIRRYLENRFMLKAPEMTTEEFLARARDAAELSNEQKNLLKEFLLCCDLVKFARYAPGADEMTAIFDSAKHFIDQTKINEPA